MSGRKQPPIIRREIMLPTEILKNDHREAMDLIEQLENAEDEGSEAYMETTFFPSRSK
jgi:hypothetical protein